MHLEKDAETSSAKMKYSRLTKEQFEELHQEFATFLATQSIDKMEWDDIKKNRPNVAEQEIDLFSDMIWEKALTNVMTNRVDTIIQPIIG